MKTPRSLRPTPPNDHQPVKTQSPSIPRASSEAAIRTLVVDDSPLMLEILAQILKAVGDFVLVGAATDGRQALRSVVELSPDLVLMDFHLPRLNGIQATEYIKRFKQPPVVVVITSDDSSTSRSLALKAGADAFVVKGGDLRERLSGTLCGLFAPGAREPKKRRRVALQTPPEGLTP